MEVRLRIQCFLHIHSKHQLNLPKVFIASKDSLRIGKKVSAAGQPPNQGTDTYEATTPSALPPEFVLPQHKSTPRDSLIGSQS